MRVKGNDTQFYDLSVFDVLYNRNNYHSNISMPFLFCFYLTCKCSCCHMFKNCRMFSILLHLANQVVLFANKVIRCCSWKLSVLIWRTKLNRNNHDDIKHHQNGVTKTTSSNWHYKITSLLLSKILDGPGITPLSA